METQFTLTVTQAIQAILSPAVMISSSAFFLSGLNARHSTLVNRVRLLNDERRRLVRELINRGELEYTENVRFLSIKNQIDILVRRIWYIRNAMLCHISAAIFFVLTSFAIALNIFFAGSFVREIPLYLFVVGLFLVLCGVCFLGIDVLISYRVILIEVKSEE
ncbi:DUF2721 domain-containing protein [Candidatus Chrysopegis kryptomonas]|uniref:DUF2721 domain-containing protein n=1 Tax=Candidatus Chryseopegocella kryptomonas TaxID=1633643 RepID=A0A0P1MN20_9BACT|nr:DUF2721 domain-containing protein [Candidatus Chrysopegis kryptomonas]CUS96941.1 Protein of unknown function (DUF2721) [Candidatus Chrysopegis kryptomonas]